MDASRWKQIDALFMECSGLEQQEWDAFLADACDGDAELMEEVRSLLEMDTGGVDFLDKPLINVGTAASIDAGEPSEAEVIGSLIGPYRIERELGSGGMGKVYLGVRTDGELKMKAAVKFAHAHASPHFTARFLRERQLLADLKHPHIAVLLDAGTTQAQQAYLIMDYIEGVHIDRWCLQNRPSLLELLKLFRKVTATAAFAHDRNVIHRDLKPANLMVTAEGEPVLLDFGIAHLAAGDDNVLTGVNQRLLTPGYAAPEQLRGAPASPAMDIYALGLILLQLLVNDGPDAWSGSPSEIISQLILKGRKSAGEPKSGLAGEARFEESIEAVPEALGHVLRTALEPNAQHRYDSAHTLTTDLDRVIFALSREQTTDALEPKLYDLLFWYHPGDRDQVLRLVQVLRQADFTVWLDIEGDETADPVRGLIKALPAAAACLVCLGPQNRAPWRRDPAIRDALAFQSSDTDIIPVLLPGADYPAKQSELPMFLRDLGWQTFPQGIEQAEGLIRRLQGEDDSLVRTHSGVCPFRGLEVFRECDREWFFGRDALVQRLAQHMGVGRFLAVLGASGSGKSSVVQAGLIPQIHAADGEVVLFTPAQNPLETLAFHLQKLMPGMWLGEQLYARLTASIEALHFIAREWASQSGKRLFLVIDQFEEVFTLAGDHTRDFLDALCFALDQEQGPVSVVLTMRSDFLGKCILYPNLNKYVSDHVIQVEPMTRDDLAAAIEKPAELTGLTLEPGLLDRILDDVAGSSAELPLLEHALLELYQRREGGLLTQAAYKEIGGIEGALAKRAEAEFVALDGDERQTLRKMFTLCLIHPGEGAGDTRRRATRPELLAVGARPEVVLKRWIEARLLTGSRDATHDQEMVDVAHEALIRKWDRIESWMLEDRETARMLQRLREMARTWHSGGRDGDHLLRGAPLAHMTELVEREHEHLEPLEREFVAAGSRREVRRKWAGMCLSGLGFLLAGIAIFLYFQAEGAKREALAEKGRAEVERGRAESKTLEANYNLALSYEQKADESLASGRADHAWLYAMTALSLDIPSDRSLVRSVGIFADPRMEEVDRLLQRTPKGVSAVAMALDPSGRYLALADRHINVYVFDLYTGACRAILADHTHQVTHLQFIGDDQLVSASRDRSVRLWTLDNDGIEYGRSQLLFESKNDVLGALAVSPDGRWLAVGSGSDINLLAAADGEVGFIPAYQFSNGQSDVTVLLFSTDDNLIAAGDDGILRRFDLDGELLEEMRGHEAGVTHLMYTRSGLLVSASKDHTLRLWQKGGGVHHLEGHADEITAVTEVNDRLLSVDKGGVTLAWNAKTGKSEPHEFGERLKGSVQLIADDRLAVVSSSGGFFMLDLRSGETQVGFSGHSGAVVSVEVSPDKTRIASSGFDDPILVWRSDQLGPITAVDLQGENLRYLTWSPDGSRLATTSRSQSANIWDVETGNGTQVSGAANSWQVEYVGNSDLLTSLSEKMLLISNGVTGEIITQVDLEFGNSKVAFSHDGKQIYYADDGVIHVWDLILNRRIMSLHGHSRSVRRLSLSPDGTRLASASNDRTVRLWDLRTGKEIKTMNGHTGMVWGLDYSPDGKLIASISFDRTLRLWDGVTGESIGVFEGHDSWIRDVKFSPDGDLLTTSSYDNTLRVWDPAGNTIAVLGSTRIPRDYAYLNGGKRMVSGSLDRTLSLWDLSSPPKPAVLAGHTDRIHGFVLFSDKVRVASISTDRTVRIWSVKSGQELKRLKGHWYWTACLAVSPDEKRIATGFSNTIIQICDVKTGELIHKLTGHEKKLKDLAYSADGKWLASCSEDGTVRLWDPESGKLLNTLVGHTDVVSQIKFSPNGSELMSSSEDKTIRVWDLESGLTSLILEAHDIPDIYPSYSPDGSLIASVGYEPDAKLWDTATGELLAVLEGHYSALLNVTFSPDGKRLATASTDDTARLWDVRSGEEIAVLAGHSGDVRDVTFSPDGAFLATGSADQTARLWDGHTGRPIATFSGHTDWVTNLKFSDDGETLVTSSFDNTLRFWNMAHLNDIHRLKSRPNEMRALTRRTFSHFGYRLDGLSLKSEPATWLEGMNGFQFPKPNPAAEIRRDVSLFDWLRRDLD